MSCRIRRGPPPRNAHRFAPGLPGCYGPMLKPGAGSRDHESPGAKEAIRLTPIRKATFLGLIALIVLLAAAATASAGPITAKKARLAAVQAQLSKVYEQSDMAVERYNEAASRLEDVQDRITRNQHLLKVAEYKLGVANDHLTARARPGLQGRRRRHPRRRVRVADLRGPAHAARRHAAHDGERRPDGARRQGVPPGDLRPAHRARGGPQVGGQAGGAARGEQGPGARAAVPARGHGRRPQERDRRSRGQGGRRAPRRRPSRPRSRRRRPRARRPSGSSSGSSSSSSSGGGGAAAPSSTRAAPATRPSSPSRSGTSACPTCGPAPARAGFDCSGLTMYCYAQIGIGLSHGATDQQRASNPGLAERAPAGRPRVLRQLQLQPPRRHLRRRRQHDPRAAHRRRGELRLHQRRLDRRPLLGLRARARRRAGTDFAEEGRGADGAPPLFFCRSGPARRGAGPVTSELVVQDLAAAHREQHVGVEQLGRVGDLEEVGVQHHEVGALADLDACRSSSRGSWPWRPRW